MQLDKHFCNYLLWRREAKIGLKSDGRTRSESHVVEMAQRGNNRNRYRTLIFFSINI